MLTTSYVYWYSHPYFSCVAIIFVHVPVQFVPSIPLSVFVLRKVIVSNLCSMTSNVYSIISIVFSDICVIIQPRVSNRKHEGKGEGA